MMAHPQGDPHNGSTDRSNAASPAARLGRGYPLATPLDAAQMLTARGWVVGPADHPDAATHCTCARGVACKATEDPTKRGKHPRVRWSELTGPASAEQLREWFAPTEAGGGPYGERTNVLVACRPSGLLVVDGDEVGALRAYAASVGQDVPPTFRVSTGRGEHHYFHLPPGAMIGNSPGALAEWHCDIRGGRSASGEFGGYVIGPGSTHYTGVIYTAEDPYAEVAQAPGWLLVALAQPARSAARDGAARGTTGGEGGPRTAASTPGGQHTGHSGVTRWDDGPRYGSAAELLAQFRRRCAELAELQVPAHLRERGGYPNGGEFRHRLFLAGRDAHRLIALGLLDEDVALPSVADAVAAVWRGVRDRHGGTFSGEPDTDDQRIVWEEALPAAEASPWRLTGAELRHRAASAAAPPTSGGRFVTPSQAATSGNESGERTTDGNRTVPAATQSAPPGSVDPGVSEALGAGGLPVNGSAPTVDYPTEDEIDAAGEDLELKKELIRQRARRKAIEQLDAEAREPVAETDLDTFAATPAPDYLVPKMLYRDGLAVIFGAPGAAKSLLALDIVLSLCTGRPWRGTVLTGRQGGRGVAHYVMAEGAALNAYRMRGWLHYHNAHLDDLRGRFHPVTRAFLLTPAGIADYLLIVARDRPDIIILDTRNLMFAGRESAGEDYGVMLRALHMIREAAGGAAIILIDHSGLVDKGRPRGNNAQLGGVDTEVMVTDDHGHRMAKITRDKNGGLIGHEWHYTLLGIDEIPRPANVDAPPVCVPADPQQAPLLPSGHWWDEELPEDAVELIEKGKRANEGRGGKAALDVLRLLRWVGGDQGYTQSEIKTLLRGDPEAPRTHSPASVSQAVNLLTEIGLTEPGATVAKHVLVRQWRKSRK